MVFPSTKQASRSSGWEGTYIYGEAVPGIGSAIVMDYKLKVFRENNQLRAYLDIDGFQTATKIEAIAKPHNEQLYIFFDKYRPGNVGEIYKNGELLFSLEKISEKDYKIIWYRLQPLILESKDSTIMIKKTSADLKDESVQTEEKITENQYKLYSKDKKFLVVKDKKTSEIYLYNLETGHKRLLEKSEFCTFEKFSPASSYIVINCGTSPIRSLYVINTRTGEKIPISMVTEWDWLNDNEIVFNNAQLIPDAIRPWGGGEGTGISKVNLVTKRKTVLKSADRFHDYYLEKILDSGLLLFTMQSYPLEEGPQERFYHPVVTYWIMDSEGDIVKQIFLSE